MAALLADARARHAVLTPESERGFEFTKDCSKEDGKGNRSISTSSRHRPGDPRSASGQLLPKSHLQDLF